MAWLVGWKRRKSHDINGQSGAGTNYQKKIVVHYTSGSDLLEDVYLNGKCETDFGDIRFTDDDGETELDYCLVEKTDGVSATFWVEVADNLDSNQTIYIYYGKSGESTTSNGINTFLFFDDFEGYVLGDLIGQGGWTGGPNQPDVVNDEVKRGIKAIRVNIEAGGEAVHTITIPDNFAMQWYMWGNTSRRAYIELRDAGNNREFMLVYMKLNDFKYCKDGAILDTGENYINNFWHKVGITSTGSGGTQKIFLDDVEVASDTSSIHNPLTILRIAMGYDGGSEFARFDQIFIRKYISPEPTHDDWGDEEEFFNLTIQSTPVTGIQFIITGVGTYYTNDTINLIGPQNYEITIVDPHVINGNERYAFDKWFDGPTDNPRTITLDADKTFTAEYINHQFLLDVQSYPITGVNFTKNATPHTTPYSEWVDENASFDLIMPEVIGSYIFFDWEDDSTDNPRSIIMTTALIAIVYYVLALGRPDEVIIALIDRITGEIVMIEGSETFEATLEEINRPYGEIEKI